MASIYRLGITLLLLFIAMPAFLLGKTWENVSLDDQQQGLVGTYFLDAARGYVVGTGGFLAATTDSGATWQRITVPTTEGLWGVYAVAGTAGTTIYVAGDNGTMLKSTDGGANWVVQDLKYSKGFTFHIFGRDANNLWVSGGEGELGATTGVIIRTTDGGATWSKSTVAGSYAFDKTYFPSQMVGYAVASHAEDFGAGGIYKSSDGGATWNLVKATAGAMNAVHCFDESNCIVAGFNSQALRTTDGGATWTPIALPPQHQSGSIFTAVTFLDPSYGFMTDAMQGILFTNDGGTTWEHDNGYTTLLPLWGIAIGRGSTSVEDPGEHVIVVVGDGGTIYRHKTRGPAPSAQVSTTKIDFDTVAINELIAEDLMLYPGTTAGLRLDSLWIESAPGPNQFSILTPGEPFPIAIVPMGTLQIRVALSANAAGDVYGTLYIKTNDPVRPIRRVDLAAVVGDGSSSVDIDASPRRAATTRLLPNPLSGAGRVAIDLPVAAHLDLSLINMRGELVASIFDGHAEAGEHTFAISGSTLPSGIYYCVTRVDGVASMERVVVVR